MGCCSSAPAAKGGPVYTQAHTHDAKDAATDEFAYAKLHKLVESVLPNPTLEVLTVFPAAFSLADASAVLNTSEDQAKQQLTVLEGKKLVQLSGNGYGLTPMVRNYVQKVAGEENEGGRPPVIRTYVCLVVAQMQQVELELADRSNDDTDTKKLQQHKADFTEVLTLITKRCGTYDGLLEDIGAPDSLQNPNVYAALGLWNHAAAMWAAMYQVLQEQIAVARDSHSPRVSAEQGPTVSPHYALATCAYNQGEACRALHQVAEAEECYKEALHLWEGLLPDEDPRMMRCLSLIAACLKARRNMASAEQCYERLFAACQSVLPPNHPEFLHAVKELADCLEAQGKVKEAQPLKALAFKSM